MKKIIAFNWKLNPGTPAQAGALLRTVARASRRAQRSTIVVCPPFSHLFTLAKANRSYGFEWGAQDCFWEAGGPYTGQVSAQSLRAAGAQWVILGHSEKRRYGNETHEQVSRKIAAAFRAGLKPLVCVSEPRALRAGSVAASRRSVRDVLASMLSRVPRASLKGIRFVYEPTWAISTVSRGATDDPVHAARMVSFVKEFLARAYGIKAPVVLYGGSVNATTIGKFLAFDDIDGFLVGAASLKSQEVSGIIASIEHNT